MKARVTVMLKDGVLDPQGEAVKNALKSLEYNKVESCLLYTSPSPRDRQKSRMPSSA